MKQAYTQTKDKAKHSTHVFENSPEEYASDKMKSATGRTVHKTAQQANKIGNWAFVRKGRTIRKLRPE